MGNIITTLSDRWKRFTTSRGFGVQSPFSFSFLLDVIRQPLPYYAYRTLAKERGKYKNQTNNQKTDELLFRLSNFVQPTHIYIPSKGWEISSMYLHEGCKRSVCVKYDDILSLAQTSSDGPLLVCFQNMKALIEVKLFVENLPDGSILFIHNIAEDKVLWKMLIDEWKTGVIYDAKTSGIIVKNAKITLGKYQITEIK